MYHIEVLNFFKVRFKRETHENSRKEVGDLLVQERFFLLVIAIFWMIWKTACFVTFCYIWSYVKYFKRFLSLFACKNYC
jgi:hypothetical protein